MGMFKSNDLPYEMKQRLGLAPADKPQRKARGKGKVGQDKMRFTQFINEVKGDRNHLWLEFALPIRTVREKTNENRYVKGRRVKTQRATVAVALMKLRERIPHLPVRVTLTRIGAKAMDVGDNLSCSMSAIRDEIARWYGIDDADPRISFYYEQEPGSKEFAVRIYIAAAHKGRTTTGAA